MKALMFSPSIGAKARLFALTTFIQYYFCIPSPYNKVRKIEDMQVGKENVMLSLFPGNMII